MAGTAAPEQLVPMTADDLRVGHDLAGRPSGRPRRAPVVLDLQFDRRGRAARRPGRRWRSRSARTWSVPRLAVSPVIDCRAAILIGSSGATVTAPNGPAANSPPSSGAQAAPSSARARPELMPERRTPLHRLLPSEGFIPSSLAWAGLAWLRNRTLTREDGHSPAAETTEQGKVDPGGRRRYCTPSHLAKRCGSRRVSKV